nr:MULTISPECIES: hypothetical protein [unclassified Allomuricauda]|tara:strand:- start:6268 stop:6972 length:705 start_codon:yes stop_codon:yes gene_type:complete
MKTKIVRLASALAGVFVLTGLIFTMSSKRSNLPTSDTIPCETEISDNLENAYISIFFEAGKENPFRKPGFEGFIPSPDIRFGDIPGGGCAGPDEFSISVRLTSPQCPNWEWVRFADNTNMDAGGTMNIKTPPPGYDLRVEVTYTEQADEVNDFDFNTDNLAGATFGTHVVYKFDMTYLGGFGGDIPQPIFLNPSYQVESKCTNCLACDGSSKKVNIADYKTINQYIDHNQLYVY